MPRVMHVISGLMVGGAERSLLRLVSDSHGRVFEHAVVSLSLSGPMVGRFEAIGVEVIQLNLKKNPIGGFVRLFQLVRNRRPDVVQTWMYHSDLLGGIASRLAGNRKIIWGIRTTDVKANGGIAIRVLRSICAALSGFVPAVIVCAAKASKDAHAGVGYRDSRMIVIPNGFDFSQFRQDPLGRSSLREEHHIDDSQVVIGTLGRFDATKDPQNFVNAVGALAEGRPNLRFMMVGRGFDWANDELTAWIRQTGYADRFILLGERNDVPQCLGAMDIFCLSSRTEGFPNALAEAMAMCLPAVTTDVGDSSMLIGNTGLVVKKEDSQALAAALHSLLSMSADDRKVLGHAACERMRAEFSVHKMRSRFESVYEELIKEYEE